MGNEATVMCEDNSSVDLRPRVSVKCHCGLWYSMPLWQGADQIHLNTFLWWRMGWMGLTNQVEWETLNKLCDEFNIYDKSFQTLNISKV